MMLKSLIRETIQLKGGRKRGYPGKRMKDKQVTDTE